MQEHQPNLIVESILDTGSKSRKDLLPWWVKVFSWIFIVFGALAPLTVVVALFGHSFAVSLYGLETNDPLSVTGIVVTLLFFLKAITAAGFLKEKDWAVQFGIVDGIIGIAICFFMMIYPFINHSMHFAARIEIFFLIPYLVKMFNIRSDWQKAGYVFDQS